MKIRSAHLVGGSALALSAWLAWRLHTRSVFRKQLEESPTVQRALEEGYVTWSISEQVAKRIPLTGRTSADQAFAQVLAEIREVTPLVAVDDLKSLIGDEIEKHTGVSVDEILARGQHYIDTTKGYVQSWVDWWHQ